MDGRLAELIEKSSRIVFFGGAGVSTESGIPDFRSVDGLYAQRWRYPPEEIISHDFFMSHTDEFYEFYRAKLLNPTARPNRAHLALARLEAEGKLRAVVTQNIDGLHQAAGSRTVCELHGSVLRNYCMRCRKFFPTEYISGSQGTPRCDACGGLVKPDVVLYGESLDESVLRASIEHLRRADLLIIGGTSLAVYPAAGLIDEYGGGPVVVINRSPTPRDRQADLLISGSIGEAFA